jgi:hypothetical protein
MRVHANSENHLRVLRVRMDAAGPCCLTRLNGSSEKTFPDPHLDPAAAAPAEAATPHSPPPSAEAVMEERLRAAVAGLISCKTYELSWAGPFGLVVLSVTDTKTFFKRHHVINIGAPPGTPFPLETVSYIATTMEIERAGGAKAFVESLIAAAESTAAWREYVARAPNNPAARHGRRPPPRPKPGRRRVKLDIPKR